jgi:hypothetical protein
MPRDSLAASSRRCNRARKTLLAPSPKSHRIGRPLCLENPRPQGGIYQLTEDALSPFQAEPAHQAYAAELNKRCRPHLKSTNKSYRVDETYIKVKGQEKYLGLPRSVRQTGSKITRSRRVVHQFNTVSEAFEFFDHLRTACGSRLLVDGWTALFVAHTLMQNLPDQPR